MQTDKIDAACWLLKVRHLYVFESYIALIIMLSTLIRQMLSYVKDKMVFTGKMSFVGFVALSLAFCVGWADSADVDSGADLLDDYTVRRWGVENGLAQGAVNDIRQFSDGFMYVVTLNHVQRFDGVAFVSLDGSAPWLAKKCVLKKIVRDCDGVLWLLSVNGLWHQFGGDWVPVSFDGKTDFLAQDLIVTDGGLLCLLAEAGLGIWDGAEFRLVQSPEEMTGQRIYKAAVAGTNSIILHDSQSLWSFDGKEFLRLPMPSTFPSQAIGNISARSSDCYWVITGGKVYAMDGAVVTCLPDPPHGMGLIMGASDGAIWVCSEKAIQRFSDGAWRVLPRFAVSGAVDARCLIEGREGIVWLGTSDGIVQFSPRSVRTLHILSPSRMDTFKSVCVEPSGALWVAVAGVGLYSGTMDSMKPYILSGPSPGNFSVLLHTRAGVRWVGTYGEHLWRVDSDGVRHFMQGIGGVSSRGINAMLEDARGVLWVGTWDGLMRFDGGRLVAEGVPSGGSGEITHLLDVVNCIIEDRAGAIWVGYQTGGLMSIGTDGVKKRFFMRDGLPSDRVQALHEDGDGVLWVGTSAGLVRMSSDGRMIIFNRENGVEEQDIRQVISDRCGFLWLGTGHGLFRLSLTEAAQVAAGSRVALTVRHFGRGDGMDNEECAGGVGSPCARTPDGRLWFCTMDGLVTVDPAAVKKESMSLSVYMEDVTADGRLLAGAGNGIFRASPLLKVQAGAQKVEFKFTAPGFKRPETLRFRWRLEGYDTGWTAPSTRRVAEYTRLPPGNYDFEVMVVDNSSEWHKLDRKVRVLVLPFFWQTWWFRGLCGLVVLLACGVMSGALVRVRSKRKLMKVERERSLEHERARIARDMHDDLGASLTRIAILSELAKSDIQKPEQVRTHVDQIFQSARTLTRSLDEIVWAVNPANDTAEQFVSYMAQFAQDFLRTAGIRCRLDMPDNVPAAVLEPGVRHNLLLVVKELLNNTVKHADATEVWVRVKLSITMLTVEVEDNGCGFDAAVMAESVTSRQDGRDGLGNLRRRMAEIGGRCEFRSSQGNGTFITLTVPGAGIPSIGD